MRKVTKFNSYFLGFILLSLLFSCTKFVTNDNIVSNTPNYIVLGIKQFINLNKGSDSLSNNHLVNNIDWDRSIKTDINSSRYFVYFPIHLIVNDSSSNGLVVISDSKQNTILESFFVHISFKNKSFNLNSSKISNEQIVASVEAMQNHFSPQKNTISNSIALFTLDNRMIYEIGYQNGLRHYIKSVSNGKLKSSITNQTSSIIKQAASCTDYYLVTRYDDGSSDWVYLYTTCTGCQLLSFINSNGINLISLACNGNTSSTTQNASGGGISSLITNTTTPTTTTTITDNPDGTKTVTFVDKSIIGSPETISFKLDANNQLIEGSQQIIVTGVAVFTQAPQQNSNATTWINPPGTPDYVVFNVQGTLGLPNIPFTLYVNPSITIAIPHGYGDWKGVCSWQYSFDGGKHYYL